MIMDPTLVALNVIIVVWNVMVLILINASVLVIQQEQIDIVF